VYSVEYFNLDAILSVGYRVNSRTGTQFRIWATSVLREHLVRGFTANERRLRELKQSLRLVEQVFDHRDVTVMIAASDPADRQSVCQMIVNMINERN